MGNLTNQVYLYSLSTDVFLNQEERKLKLHKDRHHDWKRLAKLEDEFIATIDVLETKLINPENEEHKEKLINSIESFQRQLDYFYWLNDKFENEKEITKAGIKREFNSLIENNNKELGETPRDLNELHLNSTQVISLFESTLTRKMKMKKDKLTDKMIIVEVYNYPIFDNLLKNGFIWGDKGKFVYYSSSAGQIRQKKAVFIHEESLSEIDDSLTNGLTVEKVNADGKGMSVNKYLSYKALTTSASQRWEQFHDENLIDHTIVVDDVEVVLEGRTVDFIDKEYKVTRTDEKPITLEITDGAGMMLPSVNKKSFQFRMPFMKGLLSSTPFNEFTDNATVTDIYGKEWNIKKDQVKIILFKSQFKMWSKFIVEDDKENSWLHFRESFKKNNCEAAFMNVEEDNISDAKTNYQYLQSLVKVDDASLLKLAEKTNDIIHNMATDVDTMLKILGANDENEDMNEFQQAINLYPALLNDENSREAIKNKKKKIVEEAKAGKLAIDSKFTYVLPDWYAVMQKIFLGEEPIGLLKDGEIYCSLYDEGKADLLRSPSLSFEHVIRNNTRKDGMKKWYPTKGVYVSSQDLISKVLQMDYDGDQILITPNSTLIKLAEQSEKYLDVVPLEYEMGTAAPRLIDSDSIFESLTTAFKGNIGVISNNISKVFNAKGSNFNKDGYEVIKQWTAQNNHMIDMAKTLSLPKPPKEIQKVWNKFNQQKLPYFFKYAKGKENHQVLEANDSTVNRLANYIINKRLVFKRVVGKVDWKKLLWKHTIKDGAFVIDKATDQEIIKRYHQLDREKYKHTEDENENKKKKKMFVYREIREELLKINSDSKEVADVLVRHLFINESPYKSTLWESFGVEVVEAIRKNVHSEINCVGCNETIDNPRQRQVRCDDCQKEYRRKLDREQKRQKRQALKNNMSA